MCVMWLLSPNTPFFYCFDESTITALLLWDNRRNPVRLPYLLQRVVPMNLCEDNPFAEQK